VVKMKDESAAKDEKDSLADGDPEWTRVRVGSRKINEDFLKDPTRVTLKCLSRRGQILPQDLGNTLREG